MRTQLQGLRSGRLWLALLACATTTGGVLATYSYITPILTDQAGIAPALVPLVLTGFGVGSFIGTLLGGRFGDKHPGLITILTPAVTAVVLVAISATTGLPWLMTVLVVILGLFGLSANSVLIHLAGHPWPRHRRSSHRHAHAHPRHRPSQDSAPPGDCIPSKPQPRGKVMAMTVRFGGNQLIE